MARMLYQRDSASFMLNAIRRHQRLCRKNPNGEIFIQAIQPVFDVLESRCKLLEEASLKREDAYDDVLLADLDLDNTIRNVFDTWKTYKRKHSSELEIDRIFPNGTFSDIIRMPYADEPNEADSIASKIESFGENHELYPLASEIRTSTSVVREKLENLKEAIRQQKAVEAEVEIVKMNVVRAYEINYLDARKQLGSVTAERLFPLLASRGKDDMAENPGNNNTQTPK